MNPLVSGLKGVREALDAGLGELAAMIAADLELPGPVDDAFYFKTPKGARRGAFLFPVEPQVGGDLRQDPAWMTRVALPWSSIL
jgi:hypothetical protein